MKSIEKKEEQKCVCTCARVCVCVCELFYFLFKETKHTDEGCVCACTWNLTGFQARGNKKIKELRLIN